MSAVGLLLELRARAVAVDAVDGKIRCRHAPGALPAELAERVRARREEVLALLADPDALREAAAREIFDAAPDGQVRPLAEAGPAPGPARCFACGCERGEEVAVCPVCHPAPWPPRRPRRATGERA